MILVIPTSIFHSYDIRGVYGQDLTNKAAKLLGKAFGTFCLENNVSQIIVGQDNRTSSPSLQKAFVQGAISTGCNVVDMGTLLTPMVYFSWYQLNANATAMITASHNPAQFNGLKCSLNKKPLARQQYLQVKSVAENQNFQKGRGEYKKTDLWPKYKGRILEGIKLKRKLKIAVDTGNGTTSLFVPELLKNLGLEIIELFTKSDGSFPNHQPYPQDPSFYTRLIQTIRNQKASFGLAFDGDGDRLGVYDEKGQFVSADLIAALFAKDILQKHPDSKIVLGISTSQAAVEVIRQAGGEVILSPTGYPNITQKMKEVNGVFGAEISGHFFFADRYFGYDDALYAALRLIELTSSSDKTTSELIAQLPTYTTSPEYRVHTKNKEQLVKNLKQKIPQEFPEAEILTIDGVRVNLSDKSWFLIRPSNTEDAISVRFEAKHNTHFQKIKKIVKTLLASQGVAL